MTEAVRQTTFLSLPAEVRVQIAADALQQPPDVGLIFMEPIAGSDQCAGLVLDPGYASATNLNLLLVCRQFRNEFTQLAYQKTTFVIRHRAAEVINEQPDGRLKNIRKLVVLYSHVSLLRWREWPFNHQHLHLDELCFSDYQDIPRSDIINLLRRLKNVRTIRFVMHSTQSGKDRLACNSLIGVILKADHYWRYDAPDAPRLESTWWNWTFNQRNNAFTFVAQEPKPIMEEEEYMLFVKPKIDEVMDRMAHWQS